MKQPVHAFQHRTRTDKALLGEQRRANAGLCRPAGMHSFGPGAFGEIFDDAACHAAGDPQRIDDLLGVEPQRRADTGGSSHRAEDSCGVKAGLVNSLRHHEAEATKHFGADRDAGQRVWASGMVALAGCQHRRHDHRAGMDGPAFEGVVEILAMGRGAVDEGRAGGRQRAGVPDHGARAVIVGTGQRRLDVVLVARGDTETDDVDQQVLAFAQRLGWQDARLQRRDFICERFGDGNFRQLSGHERASRENRSDVEDSRVAGLDGSTLLFHGRGIVLQGLDVTKRLPAWLFPGLRMQ